MINQKHKYNKIDHNEQILEWINDKDLEYNFHKRTYNYSETTSPGIIHSLVWSHRSNIVKLKRLAWSLHS